jgi:hypothetical protein
MRRWVAAPGMFPTPRHNIGKERSRDQVMTRVPRLCEPCVVDLTRGTSRGIDWVPTDRTTDTVVAHIIGSNLLFDVTCHGNPIA